MGEPLELPCGAVLANRLAKAAMSEQLADLDGRPGPGMFRLYRQWAAGGAALLLTGNVMVDPAALGEPLDVTADERDGPAGSGALYDWADTVRGTPALLWMQINHPGRQSFRLLSPRPVAPSAVRARLPGRLFARPRALTEEEIEALIARFARTARAAARAGFGGVQIHAAHGYLISQFLSPATNRRTDGWGGSARRRRRFLLEVVRAVRAAVGDRVAVSVKLNSADFQRGAFDESESLEVVRALDDAGIDLLEISGGTYEQPAMLGAARGSTRAREAYFLRYAAHARRATGVPLMVTGGWTTGRAMSAALREGTLDVIGLARPLCLTPDLPKRLLEDETLTVVRACPRAGVRVLDSLLEVHWHTQQLHRLARGLAPDPRRGALRSLAVSATREPVNAWRRRGRSGRSR